ncbi:MAG TPA: hypothetical protein VIG51_06705 [Candidatus Baltobacteraceae bacterium]|jgi:tetratricopeptide (TPR) repeat protein
MTLLSEALEAEARGRVLESFALCSQRVRESPADPDALTLMGRLCALGGDLCAAIGLQRHALAIDPSHVRAAEDLTRSLALRASPDEGEALYAQAVGMRPDIDVHYLTPGALDAFDGIDGLRALLERAVAADPAHSRAHAALANVLTRQNDFAAALQSYQRALLLDPANAAVQLATGDIEYDFGNEGNAQRHRANAFARQALYLAAARSVPYARSVLVLARPGPWAANVPLDFVVDHDRIAVHRLYLPVGKMAAVVGPLPPYDLIFNAVAYAEAATEAIALAEQFIASQAKPAINLPQHLWKTARSSLPAALRDVPACSVPEATRIAREIPAGVAFPLIARPVDSHAGRGLERVDDAGALDAYIARHPGDAGFDLAPFVDYRSADGYYRKYRVMFIGGVAFPYHLAISRQWIVHYNTSLMPDNAWMRAEEEAFLDAPQSVFARWEDTTRGIAAAIGLDYFGVDCTVSPDGGMLVFEADAAMFVHAKDPPNLFPYKPQAVDRIRAALNALIITTDVTCADSTPSNG